MTAAALLKTVAVISCVAWFSILGYILLGWWGLVIVAGIFGLFGLAAADK